jgi:hypothetical protein
MSDKTYTEEEFNSLQAKSDDNKSKLDEFRSNNVKLMKDMETLSAKFDGIDLDGYQDMVKQQQSMKDKKLLDAGKIDELLEERTKSMRELHNKELEKVQGTNKTLNTQLETLVIDNAVRDSAAKSGVVDTGIDDVLLRSQSVFSLKDGKAVPHDRDGNVIYGEGNSEPMSVQEWVKVQMEVAPHLFKSSQGGGSEHGKNFSGKGSQELTALQKLQVGFAK